MKPVRRSIFPTPDDTWETIAARELPKLDTEQAVASLQSWNLYVFARRTPPDSPRAGNPILPSDIIFVEAPLARQ
ncbi:MAG TPA: hypothetical protein VJ998_12665 [Pseudomonadales bacterium]|nr:hypothetical protein [Pseudomonadales bacterium]